MIFPKRFFTGVALTLVTLLPASSALAQEAQPVDVKNFTYAPTEIHIAAGQTRVRVDQRRLHPAHDHCRRRHLRLGLPEPGRHVHPAFDTPGTYQYYCLPHGGPRPLRVWPRPSSSRADGKPTSGGAGYAKPTVTSAPAPDASLTLELGRPIDLVRTMAHGPHRHWQPLSAHPPGRRVARNPHRRTVSRASAWECCGMA